MLLPGQQPAFKQALPFRVHTIGGKAWELGSLLHYRLVSFIAEGTCVVLCFSPYLRHTRLT